MLAFNQEWVLVNPMKPFPKQRGISLIEIVVVVAILGILMSVGAPTFQLWIANSRIRSVADSMHNGLQITRAEALKTNNTVCFVPMGGSNGESWCVSRTAAGVCGDVNEVTNNVSPYLTAAQAGVVVGALPLCYNGMGTRPLGSAALDLQVIASDSVQAWAVGKGRDDELRRLMLRVSPLGQVRYCDQGLPATDPRSC